MCTDSHTGQQYYILFSSLKAVNCSNFNLGKFSSTKIAVLSDMTDGNIQFNNFKGCFMIVSNSGEVHKVL